MKESLYRNIEIELKKWKTNRSRKPLLLRGARQVGKTTIVNNFSKLFDHYIYLNLELSEDARFFLDFDEAEKIMNQIILAKGLTIQKNESVLLFIDEVQEVPKAIALLRYFYEKLNYIHVIAAGSLLELALGKVSKMPVGRVQFLHMHPLNFSEYLINTKKNAWVKAFNTIPVQENAHIILQEQFHKYCILGGMPEIVKHFLKNENVNLLNAIYQNIWSAYSADVEKYGVNQTERHVIRHILNTAPFYLDERIKFQNFGNSNYRSREVSEAFKSLDAVGVIRLIYPTTSVKRPVVKDFKKSPRMLFLDVGIINNIRKAQSELLNLTDLSEGYRGALIPQIIYQEIISTNSLTNEKPTFWVRDKTQSSAEVDLIIEHEGYVIPVEIKSGSTGSLKSLHQFINRSNHPYAVRIYGGEFSIQEQTTPEGKDYFLMNLPYYLGTKINDYISYFLETVN